MILYRWRGTHRNFGDELNDVLWPRLLPGFFDQNEAVRFLGIGSVLDNRHDPAVTKLVAGSGYGGYEARTALDPTWVIHWVRGPRTALHLGLPPALGIGDPASLVRQAGLAPVRTERDIGFMPHFESAVRGAWRDVAQRTGMTLIDPRDDPLSVIAALGRCRVLLSEALHGVIVADALRVPWIAIRPLAPIHRPKWLDWADTLDLNIAFRPMTPSSLLERAHLSGVARFRAGRDLLHRQAARLRDVARERHIDAAVRAIRAIPLTEPQLSRDAALDRARSRMLEAIQALRRAPLHGWRPCASAADGADASRLRTRAVSAYQDISGSPLA